MLKEDDSIFSRVNQGWDCEWPKSRWQFIFYFFWHSLIEPKKSCFRWLLLLRKLVVGSFLSVEDLMSIKCDVCDMQESFEHVFFECEYAWGVWSIFLGPSLVWNHKPNLSWSEVLADFVESFDFKMNRFWYVLSCEVLWFLWKERNGEIYKEDTQSVHYFRKHMDMLQPKEIEALTQYMRKLKLEDSDG
ncbi:hypothetical protein SUGI_0996680 [Cryptomeria japonica]|nr:hypothetical protein SUGI_0996680 [Cryptomeria japonica]